MSSTTLGLADVIVPWYLFVPLDAIIPTVQSVEVSANDDAIYEGNQTFVLSITNKSNTDVTVTIVDEGEPSNSCLQVQFMFAG